MTGCSFRLYERLDTFPDTIEQELRPAVCERRIVGLYRFKENYSIGLTNNNKIHVLFVSKHSEWKIIFIYTIVSCNKIIHIGLSYLVSPQQLIKNQIIKQAHNPNPFYIIPIHVTHA